MAESTVSRRVHVASGGSEELRVPADVADLLGDDAELAVGPGPVVTLRPGRLRQVDLAGAVPPVESSEQLICATSPLTQAERAALAEFLRE